LFSLQYDAGPCIAQSRKSHARISLTCLVRDGFLSRLKSRDIGCPQSPCRRFMQDFPGWVEKQEQDVVLVKLDLMPDSEGRPRRAPRDRSLAKLTQSV
jgi:hypothetical protein